MAGGPVIVFSERDAMADGSVVVGSHVAIEFSATRRGVLASLGREAAYVRFWDIMAPQEDTEDRWAMARDSTVTMLTAGTSSVQGKRSWAATIPWTGAGVSTATGVGNQSYLPAEQHQTWGAPLITDTRRSTSLCMTTFYSH